MTNTKIPEFTLNFNQMYYAIKLAIAAGNVPLVLSQPGIGKSALAEKYAKDHNLYLIDFRAAGADITDFTGLPAFDHQLKTAMFMTFDTFPTQKTELPKHADGTSYAGWLLFFDEVTNSPMPIQHALYKIFYDRMVGHAYLHDKVQLMGAGNRAEDLSGVETLSTALLSRVTKLTMKSDVKIWSDWAVSNVIQSVYAYIQYSPTSLNNFNAEKVSENNSAFACERSWEKVSNTLKAQENLNVPEEALTANILGTIGKEEGSTFMGFLRIYKELPCLESIYTDPLNAKLPTHGRKDMLLALTIKLALEVTEENVTNAMKYILRFPEEFQVKFVKTATQVGTEEEQTKRRNIIKLAPDFLKIFALVSNLNDN